MSVVSYSSRLIAHDCLEHFAMFRCYCMHCLCSSRKLGRWFPFKDQHAHAAVIKASWSGKTRIRIGPLTLRGWVEEAGAVVYYYYAFFCSSCLVAVLSFPACLSYFKEGCAVYPRILL